MSAANTSEVFSKMLKIQCIATISVALVLMILFGLNSAISAILGGGAVMFGATSAAIYAKKSNKSQEASAILIHLLKAEAIKIVIIIALLLLIFKYYGQLVPFALIAGLAASAIFSGAALSKLNV